MNSLKKTHLYDEHVKLGARMGEFAGFSMPIFYRGILQEHQSVRKHTGLFDLCHMGRIWVRGKGAFDFLQNLITNDLRKLKDGKILYTPICNFDGGVLDDILVYQSNPQEYFLIVNASNLKKDYDWFVEQSCSFDVSLEDVSQSTCLLAIQGPFSQSLLDKFFPGMTHKIPYYHFVRFPWRGYEVLLSRTGYTGEDGFEINLPASLGVDLWKELIEGGRELGVMPIGLGARDTLRLEMRYLLYGHDMSDETTPLEAGLGWTVCFNKGEFIGGKALELQRQKGLTRRLVGFEMIDHAIPRQDCQILRDGLKVGKVTSGSFSPTLNKNIGLGYVDIVYAHVGIPVYVMVRDAERLAEVVKTPFYRGAIRTIANANGQKSSVNNKSNQVEV